MKGVDATLLDFYKFIHVTGPDACWLWTGRLTYNGYGESTFKIAGTKRAARIAYYLVVGDLKPNMEIDHLCKTRSCVNPRHLEQVTRVENLRRSNGITEINRLKTHCAYGHPFNEDNTAIRNGARQCRECLRRRAREYYWQKKVRSTYV